MKYFRQTLNAFIVVAVSVVLALLAYESLEGIKLSEILDYAIFVLDVAIIVATFVNLIYYRKNVPNFILTLLPGIAMAVAMYAKVFDWTIPNFALLIFDLYLLYWYGYLVFSEQEPIKESAKENTPSVPQETQEILEEAPLVETEEEPTSLDETQQENVPESQSTPSTEE